ncbi:MAG: sigma-70 family RNA polymerase sigma factor [bacterium]|nr:sigma-70 family RNA polymerase sigma factor [bacterium]
MNEADDQSIHDDRRDAAAAQRGDSAAFERLIQRHQQSVSRLMWRFSRDERMVRELTHDAFVAAFDSLRTYRGDGAFGGWLRTIAIRTGYRYWKRNRRLAAFVPLEEAPQAVTPDPRGASHEAAEELFRLLERLEPDDRVVLTLYYWEEYSVNEIAERLGWSQTYVKVRLHRARGKLKRLLLQKGMEESR